MLQLFEGICLDTGRLLSSCAQVSAEQRSTVRVRIISRSHGGKNQSKKSGDAIIENDDDDIVSSDNPRVGCSSFLYITCRMNEGLLV